MEYMGQTTFPADIPKILDFFLQHFHLVVYQKSQEQNIFQSVHISLKPLICFRFCAGF